VNHHGGKIWADSDPGHWARFTLEVPQPIPPSIHSDHSEVSP
jgi:signal transduction histidine kinase